MALIRLDYGLTFPVLGNVFKTQNWMPSAACSNPTLTPDAFACWWLSCTVTWDAFPEKNPWLLNPCGTFWARCSLRRGPGSDKAETWLRRRRRSGSSSELWRALRIIIWVYGLPAHTDLTKSRSRRPFKAFDHSHE